MTSVTYRLLLRSDSAIFQRSSTLTWDLNLRSLYARCFLIFYQKKFGICRGFAVNAKGVTAGDDIIIYDRERFPTLRTMTNRAFDKKDMVPIEAIYAYIEAKHTLDAKSFHKAVAQVQAVKLLCSQREPVSIYQTDPYVECNTLLPPTVLHWPKHRSPVFGMILSRYSVGCDGNSRATSSSDIDAFLRAQLECMKRSSHPPDLIVAGPDNYLSPAQRKEDGQNLPSLHYIPDSTTGYQVIDRPGVGFGAALAQLAGAIDWARLGRMSWIRIVNDARLPESSTA